MSTTEYPIRAYLDDEVRGGGRDQLRAAREHARALRHERERDEVLVRLRTAERQRIATLTTHRNATTHQPRAAVERSDGSTRSGERRSDFGLPYCEYSRTW